MRKIFLFVAILFASVSWGADISNFASGFENGTTGINKKECDAIDVSTDGPRTGSKCLSTAFNGTDAKYWYPYVTFEVPDGSYFHVIGYAKLKSGEGRAYADARVFQSKMGTQVNLTTEWTRFTASSDKSESDEIGAEARFYRKHASKNEVLFDDVVAYVSTNEEVDLTAPTAAASASATETEITWTPGTDTNTGVQKTLIWKRIDGTANDLTLNPQGIYALTATDGPKVDQSGHWELVKVLAGDATSYSESFGSMDVYAIVHRDLAYNYSEPKYVTTPDLTTKTIYLKPNENWLKDEATFAVYCYGNGEKVYEMTLVPDNCGSNKVYKAEVRARYPKLKFYRMNSSATTIWNQTGELTMPTTEAGAYDKPNNEWDGSNNSHWKNQPLYNCVSGNRLCFVGEQLTLTSTSPGATSYQWYKGGTGDGNKIPGATSATYTKDFEFGDAGDYYCKSRIGTWTEITSGKFTVKTLRMYFNDGRYGSEYGHVDLKNTDPDHNIASGMIILGGPWTYGFNVADGIGNYYGCNNDDEHKMWSGNCTDWHMNANKINCLLQTTPGAFATYSFIVDYSNDAEPVVTAGFPDKQQQAGKVVYFDNSPVNWTKIHYRVGVSYDPNGRDGWTTKQEMTLVPGTTNLYQCLTPEKSNIGAWHIGNNCGWEGEGTDRSIFLTDVGAPYQITHSIEFEGAATSQAITIIPQSTGHKDGCSSIDSDSRNCQCYFHKYSTETGMLTHHVTVDNSAHGTITVKYTDVNGASQTITNGNERDLAHTCILTIEATPASGYSLTSLLVNDATFTNPYTLTEDIIIKAEFEPKTYNVTLHTNDGIIIYGDVTEYIFGEGATLPTDVIQTGKDFTGWYADEGLTIGPVTEIPADATGDKEFWAGWKNPPASFQYILGSCYVNKEGMWTAGNDGEISAWRYIPGADVASGTLLATDHISISTEQKASQYFNSKDLTLLDTEGSWGTSSTGARTIKAIKVGSGDKVTFDLGSLQATKIIFYAFPGNNASYKIDLTVNGTKRTKTFASGKQGKWHRYQYRGSLSGAFSIESEKETRVVVVVEIPKVTITFDKNLAEASGTMTPQDVLKGHAETLKENEFENDDYFFLGWTEDAGGSGTLILDGAAYSASEDVTLYAQWEKKIYSTVHLVATDAYNHYTSSVKATYKLSMPGITTLPMRAGYVFDGYYDAPDGGGTQYYTGLGVSVRTWDKTDAEATLYAKWTLACDLEPTLTNAMPIVTIWDGKYVDEGIVKLSYDFDAEGITYSIKTAEPSEPLTGDLHFALFDDQIHIIGTSAWGNTTAKTITVTFTIVNDCDPAHTSQPFTSTIRINPSSQKPKVAFIITGKKNDAFTAYSAADATACDDLATYLNGYFDVTFVNGYATKDEDDLADYYKDYDLLVITDFLDTKAGYTNALGTLIDKKPILSFEAYVAGLPNWHIGSDPVSPSPKVKDMKVLCAGHAVFKDIVNLTDTTVHVLDALSTADKAKGLQGFTVNEAPDFIFLATIRDKDHKRDLIVCCERQVVFPARLLIYGINSFEMGNLSNNGKTAMRQMIEYLLMTDETKVADCSLVFDNASGDKQWNNPANWAPGYNIIPTPYHPTRIIAECHVTADNAHAGSVKINKGLDKDLNPVSGSLIIEPTGGLTIAGMVAQVNDTRYASPITIKAADLLIEANETNNGALVYGNKESDVRATVQYYSRGENAKTPNPVWQYMGIPFQAGQTAIQMYYAAWMCRWSTASDKTMGGLWQWVENEDVLLPFEGYCITQEAAKTYEFAGKLNPPITTTIVLDNRDADGYAFAANSWTAPIKIQEMQDADFINAEKSIYIYHTGTYKNWQDNGTPVSAVSPGSAATLPGQYAVIPIHSSPYLANADSVIPAMQGFFVHTTAADAELKLVYNRTVYDATYFKTSTQPMRAPRSDRPEVMQLIVSGENYGDRVHLLARNDFSDEYQDGWDGRKIEGDEGAPMLAVVKEAGNMAVAAIESLEERELSFRAGNETEYTFCFQYEGETIYLYDRLADQAVEIKTGNTYSFTAENKTAAKRFIITKNPPRIPTGIENTSDASYSDAEKCIIDGQLYIIKDNRFYDARGVRVHSFNRKEVTP